MYWTHNQHTDYFRCHAYTWEMKHDSWPWILIWLLSYVFQEVKRGTGVQRSTPEGWVRQDVLDREEEALLPEPAQGHLRLLEIVPQKIPRVLERNLWLDVNSISINSNRPKIHVGPSDQFHQITIQINKGIYTLNNCVVVWSVNWPLFANNWPFSILK